MKDKPTDTGQATEKRHVLAEHWYQYGNRVKYVGLYEPCGRKPPDDDGGDFWRGLVDSDTGELVKGPIKADDDFYRPLQAEETETDPDAEKSRFRQSIQRARGMVEQYANCNHWQYFLTLTLDEQKRDRADLDAFSRDFSEMLRRIKKETGESPKYVTVPELHADGVNWHMHGLGDNIPESELVQITSVERRPLPPGERGKSGKRRYEYVDQNGDTISAAQARKFFAGRKIYRWPRYERNFGFCIVEEVISDIGAACYCTKMFRYMFKSIRCDEDGRKGEKKHGMPTWKVLDAGKHLYYCSRGLEGRNKIAPNDVATAIQGLKPGKLYTYEKCEVRWYNQSEL